MICELLVSHRQQSLCSYVVCVCVFFLVSLHFFRTIFLSLHPSIHSHAWRCSRSVFGCTVIAVYAAVAAFFFLFFFFISADLCFSFSFALLRHTIMLKHFVRRHSLRDQIFFFSLHHSFLFIFSTLSSHLASAEMDHR